VIKDLEDTGGENIVDGTFSRVNDTDVGANGALTENLEDGELEEEEAASAGAGHNEVRTENGQVDVAAHISEL